MKYHRIFGCFLLFVGLVITPITSQNTEHKNITKLIKNKKLYNQKYGYGFRIQIYYGIETKAKEELEVFKVEFPKIGTHIDYSDPPYWRSQVGDYRTRLEADKALNVIKAKFSSAIVVPR
jgi:hypothetical protein